MSKPVVAAFDLIVSNEMNIALPVPRAWMVLRGSPWFSWTEGGSQLQEGWVHYPIVKVPNKGGFIFQRLGHEAPTALAPTGANPSDIVEWSPSIDKRPIWPRIRWDGDDPVLVQIGTIDLPIPIEPVHCPEGSIFGLMFWTVRSNVGQPWGPVTALLNTRFRVTGEYTDRRKREVLTEPPPSDRVTELLRKAGIDRRGGVWA